MTTDKILEAIQSLITDASPVTYDELNGIPVYISQEDDERAYPCILVADQGAEEHEVLRGMLDPLVVETSLHTIPNDDEDDGTTQEQHRAISVQLYDLLADVTAIDTLNAADGVKVFDIRTDDQRNGREEGRNTSTISQEIVCCLDN